MDKLEATKSEKAAAHAWLSMIANDNLTLYPEWRRSAAILLQELAKPASEPDGEVVAGTGSLNDLVVIKWISDYHPKVGDKNEGPK